MLAVDTVPDFLQTLVNHSHFHEENTYGRSTIILLFHTSVVPVHAIMYTAGTHTVQLVVDPGSREEVRGQLHTPPVPFPVNKTLGRGLREK